MWSAKGFAQWTLMLLVGFGGVIGAPGDYVVPMRLTDAFGGLVGDRKELLQGHHSADNDAAMCWFLCKELASRCASD